MGDVVPFVPLADQPHRAAIVKCQMCDWRVALVWPARTELRQQQCDGCGRDGTLTIIRDIPPETVGVKQ